MKGHLGIRNPRCPFIILLPGRREYMARRIKKTEKLLHVPNKAIRSLLFSKVESTALVRRYLQVTKGTTVKSIGDALMRSTKETLIKIVNACPEIDQKAIEDCFEDNRYSARPSFQIYMLIPIDPKLMHKEFMKNWGKNKGLAALNQILIDEVHSKGKWKNIEIIDQSEVDPSTLEFSFSYHERYEYIEPETEDSKHVYELKYGFFWMNIDERFVSISVPTDSISTVLALAIQQVFKIYTTSVNISDNVMKRMFKVDDLKSSSLYHPKPPEGMPQRFTVADPHMGSIMEKMKGYEEYGSARSTYQEEVEEDTFSSLGINLNKGKIYLTRQLKASTLRRWGLQRIKQLTGYMKGIYEKGTLDEQFEVLGLNDDETLKDFTHTNEERAAILSILKTIMRCKQNEERSMSVIEYNVENLYKVLRKHTTAIFKPFCGECQHYNEIVCPSCGKAEVVTIQKKGELEGSCGYCHESVALSLLTCTEGHRVKVTSYYDGMQMIPQMNLNELLNQLAEKYFRIRLQLGEKTNFYLIGNTVYVTKTTTSSKVMYHISDIRSFKPVWDRTLTDERKAEVTEILQLLKEKCSNHSVEGCRKCQSEKSLLCIMKPFATFTDHKLHPHHGQEFGDVSFTMELENLGISDAVFVGMAKSYEEGTITQSHRLGREMIQQFIAKCIDDRVHVLGLIIAADVDQGLIAMCRHLAEKHNKKVMMWCFDELVLAVDFALEKLGLNPVDVKKAIVSDTHKRTTDKGTGKAKGNKTASTKARSKHIRKKAAN